jgi:dihydroneopterin aldolase
VTDQIAITGIRGHGHHGVFAHERADGQDFVVDVVLDVSTSAAAASDALDDTVDYGAVATAVHARITGEPVDLIETLAERIAESCLGFPGVTRVAVTVHKPGAPIAVPFDDVELRIIRGGDGG